MRGQEHLQRELLVAPVLTQPALSAATGAPRWSPGTRKVSRISTQTPLKVTESWISKRGSPMVLVTKSTKSRQQPMPKQTTGPVAAIKGHKQTQEDP